MNKTVTVVLVLIAAVGVAIFIVKNNSTIRDNNSVPKAHNEQTKAATTSTGAVTAPVGSNNSVDLSGQGLTTVPLSVFDKKEVTKLDISNNKLQGALPGEVRLLQGLTALDLSDNNFTGVPAEIGQLTNLEILDLSNNSITGLPQELGNLRSLRILDLRGNEYSIADLNFIKQRLPSSVEVLVD